MAIPIKIYLSRQLQGSDYEEMVRWGKFWRFPLPPKEFLPDDATGGVMIECDGIPCCAGFLYFTNSGACWLEYVVSNPDVKDKEMRQASLNVLIDNLVFWAKDNGYTWIFTSVKNPHLINKYLEHGFEIGSNGTTEMIKKV